MAELAVIMSMISVTSTATSILGIIKRRCGASQTIAQLATKCAELVDKVRTLLETLEGGAQVPQNTRGISTALHLRREEFDAILKNLDKMNRRTKCTHPVDRTEKFIMAQGWAKKMEAIHNDLIQLRNGIEILVSSWDVAKLVTKSEDIVTVDVSKKKESEKWREHAENRRMGSRTVDVDQYLMTMVKLNDANKAALSQYGNLDELSLPDALFLASEYVLFTDITCYIELLERSAELFHPSANLLLGLDYRDDDNPDLAVSHFRIASSRGDISSMIELMNHYDHEKDRKSVLKYIEMASSTGMSLIDWIRFVQFAIGYSFESTQLMQRLIGGGHFDYALQQSICHFFGIGATKCYRQAIDALQAIDFGYCSAYFTFDIHHGYKIFADGSHVVGDRYSGNKSYRTAFRNYTDFLLKENQIVPFLLLSLSSKVYSSQKWERNALHAASSNCIDAHIFLAEYYSRYVTRNDRKIERHIRIAADAGHSDAQSICRRLLEGRAKISKEVRLVEESRSGRTGRKSSRSYEEQSKRNKEEPNEKPTTQTSKNWEENDGNQGEKKVSASCRTF